MNFVHTISQVFRSPFRGLLLTVWIYFLLCFVAHPGSAIMHGHFIDPDDPMYLTQTLNWVEGQGWYDRIEHRLDPPEGTPIHFSRLMELPYAATILLLRPLFGTINAAIITSALWPPLFFLGLLLIFRRHARCFMPTAWVPLSALVSIFARDMTFVFMPGQVDHHGFIALLVTLCVTCLSISMMKPESLREPIIAGSALALALSLGLESLPWLLVLSIMFGIWSVVQGGVAAKAGWVFSLALSLCGVVFLMSYKLPSAWFDMDLLAFSSVYVLILLGITACFSVVFAVRPWPLSWRLIAASLFVCGIGSSFLLHFPQLLTGPYGAADKKLVQFMLPNITEAIPMIHRVNAINFYLCFLPWPLLSLVICGWQIIKKHQKFYWPWILLGVLQTVAIVLSTFYQSRYSLYAQIFGVIPLTFLLQYGLRNVFLTKLQKAGSLLVLPLLMLAIPAFCYNLSWVDAFLFPMQGYEPPCDVTEAAARLSQPPYYQGTPRIILNTIDEGPALLLRTPHYVLSAPFHTDVRGNLDSAAFFKTADTHIAENVIRRRRADFVLSCRDIETAYLVSNTEDTDYGTNQISISMPPPMALQLTTQHPPSWLEPIRLPSSGRTLLFEVKKF